MNWLNFQGDELPINIIAADHNGYLRFLETIGQVAFLDRDQDRPVVVLGDSNNPFDVSALGVASADNLSRQGVFDFRARWERDSISFHAKRIGLARINDDCVRLCYSVIITFFNNCCSILAVLIRVLSTRENEDQD
ncbi:MAG TPA: hypothetical protein VM658_01870 [bacterium]|nr:hypothetical protein [bacterium]